MALARTRSPSTVFTPKGDTLTEMYVARPVLEEAFRKALESPKSIVLHGESGSGKTWLYKKTFVDAGVIYRTANLGRASSLGSIANVLETMIARESPHILDEITEAKEAKASAFVLEGQLSSQRSYRTRRLDVFEEALASVRAVAGRKPAVLVFENIEQILNKPELIQELGSYLLLVDDASYSKQKVKILLVATASDVRSYLAGTSNANTIINRIYELPEVARLTPVQAERFVIKGLFELLGYRAIESELSRSKFVEDVLWFTDRIPQYLHELCLEIALAAESSGRAIGLDKFREGLVSWIRSSMISEVSTIEANLTSKQTVKQRKEQVLYAMGRCVDQDFDFQKIEEIVRKQFRGSCDGIKLNVSQALGKL
jgi:hypothetical protein